MSKFPNILNNLKPQTLRKQQHTSECKAKINPWNQLMYVNQCGNLQTPVQYHQLTKHMKESTIAFRINISTKRVNLTKMIRHATAVYSGI